MLRQLAPGLILDNMALERSHGRFEAIAMFVDLSGFSALSEVLIQYGREGAEVLTAIINRLFDPVIAEVYARGGFISTFAGDAFTALFPCDRPDVIFQAILAAFAIQEMVTAQQSLETRLGVFPLAVKVGLDVGNVMWGILGQEQARAYYFRGPAINGCARAEALARPGQIICSERLWPAIGDGAQGQPVEHGYLLLSHAFDAPRGVPQLPSLSAERLAPFVSDAILHLHVPAEFRNVCSVFISFDEPAEHAALDAFVTTTMSLVHIYGGYFNKVDFGDKGSVILALFGAPISYENNIERASEFLLALREQRNLPLWRAGITFGAVYAGLVGGEARCEYTAIGDVVNMSCRLMTQADWGDNLTDASVKIRLAAYYHFDFLGRCKVKGKREPIPVYRLAARRAKAALSEDRKPFFGREQELADLRAWASPVLQAHAGQAPVRARFVHVYGDAGVGKTRLLAALREQLQKDYDFRWLRCPADAILRQSLNPFVYSLKRFFDQSPDQTPEENKAVFEGILTALMERLPGGAHGSEAVKHELQRTHSMLGALLDLRWDGSLNEQLEPQLRFENTLLAILNFIKALSLLQPVLLEIDGGHLLDGDSRTLLQLMISELDAWPVGVLVTGRRETAGRVARLPSIEDGVWMEMNLSPLTVDEVEAMAAEVFGGDLTPSTTRFMFEMTSGNPLFVEQFVQDLRERGAFVAADEMVDAYTLAATEIDDIPTTIDAVLISRLDRLAPPVRDLVQTASVLGREFEIPILALMSPQTPTLPNLMRAAETERIWTAFSESHYAYVQALLRDAAYNMQMGERLRQLHRLAAGVYEYLYAGDLSPYYADLAYHFEKGEHFSKAVFYLQKAGDQARANYQNEMALSLYKRLLTYVEGEERAQAYEYRGDILHGIGSYDGALEAYASALDIWEQQDGINRRVADIYRKIASIHVDKGEYEEAIRTVEQAEARLGDQSSVEMVRVDLLYAGIFYRQGRTDEALVRCQRGLSIATAIEARREMAHGRRLLGTIHTGLGDLSDAEQDYLSSLDFCRELGDLRQETMASNSLGAVYYYQGEWALSEHYYRQSLESAEEIGFVDQQATVSNNLGELYLLQGRFEDAELRFQKCLSTWRSIGFLVGVALSYRNLAQIAANRQEWDDALAYLSDSLETLQALGSRDWMLAEVYRQLAEVKLALGEQQDAWNYCRQALDIAMEQNIKLVASNARRVVGQLYRAEGQVEKAEAALKQSLELAESLGMRYEQGKAWFELALLYQMQEQHEVMQSALTQAGSIFTDLNALWDQERVEALSAQANGATVDCQSKWVK